MSVIRCWDVYEVWRTATQKKMFICLYYELEYEFGQKVIKWYGFYINSNSQRMDTNFACDVDIDWNTHRSFLDKDSKTNVAELVKHDAGELRERVGFIEAGTCDRITMAIELCGLLERSKEVKIMEAIRASRSTANIRPPYL